jgi:hypothetical protein
MGRKLDTLYKVGILTMFEVLFLILSSSHSCSPNLQVYQVVHDTIPEVSLLH